MPTVTFLPHEKSIVVPDGENLLRAAMEAGVHINASCGGDGVCGKCRILIEEGRLEGGLSDRISQEDQAKGYRLACQAKVAGQDVAVRIPVESSIDVSVLKRQATPRQAARIHQPDFESLREQGLFLPPVEEIYLELPEPNAADNQADASRLVNFLTLNHDEHRLVVTMSVIRKLPEVLREDSFRVTATLARSVQPGRKTLVINVQPGDATDRNYAIAMDIGTTTIYGQLIDLKTGEVLAEKGDFNAQISYGEDVITRIMAAEKPGGLEKLHEVVTATMNKIIAAIVKQAGVHLDDINAITLAGNTTMTQLFLKVNPRYIRRSPYVPASNIYPPLQATGLGLALGDHAAALVYPQVSSYVGGISWRVSWAPECTAPSA